MATSVLSTADRTNSKPQGPALSAHGIDTVSYAYRPHPDIVGRLMDRMDRYGYLESPNGEGIEMTRTASDFIRVREPVGPFRLGFYGGLGLMYADARLGAALAGTDDDHSLKPPERLPVAQECARRAWRQVGIDLGDCQAAIRRVDPAAELLFEDGREGLRFLRTLGGMTLTKLQRVRHDSVDGLRVETVSFFRPKKKQRIGRAYDKGVEALTHRPGERIRLELQMRFEKSKQRRSEQLTDAYCGEQFVKRFDAWRKPVDGIVVGDLDAIADAVYDREADGRIKPENADALLGYFAFVSRYGKDEYIRRCSERSYYRQRGRARKLGLYLDAAGQRVESTDTARYIGMMVDAWKLPTN